MNEETIRSTYKVNFFRPKGHEGPVYDKDLQTLCLECANNRNDIELIDVAGEWDECQECHTQNKPTWN